MFLHNTQTMLIQYSNLYFIDGIYELFYLEVGVYIVGHIGTLVAYDALDQHLVHSGLNEERHAGVAGIVGEMILADFFKEIHKIYLPVCVGIHAAAGLLLQDMIAGEVHPVRPQRERDLCDGDFSDAGLRL